MKIKQDKQAPKVDPRSDGVAPDRSPETEEVEHAQTPEELWETCKDLAIEENILGRVEEAVREGGFAGPTSGVMLVYLAIMTRLLERPVSVALRGPSSAGKSFTLKKAAALHPPEAYLTLTAMSDKALVYMKHDLRHRMLIINEAAGINGGMFAYALRSLLSEGCIDYEYTDFELKRTVSVHREGPTGLLTSAAGGIDFELATRLITPNVADTAELTRAIMLAEAEPEDGSLQTVPTEVFHALQRHIALGSTEVVVPFALELAENIDPTAVRMRRDFPSLLALIQAHALLHQHTRDRAGTKVIAEVRDYAAVYDLTAEMIAEGAELVVPESVRECVDAVRDMQSGLGGVKLRVTMAALAGRLGISRSAASRRVKRAMRQGFIQDISPDKGGPRILETAEPMPSDTQVLPHPSALRRS